MRCTTIAILLAGSLAAGCGEADPTTTPSAYAALGRPEPTLSAGSTIEKLELGG